MGLAQDLSQEPMKEINRRQTLVIAAVLLALIGAGLYGARILPIRVRSMEACVAILKQLDGAKNTWALEYQKTTNDIPTDSDLFGPNSYIREKKKCPRGGRYTIGRIGELPKCSIPEHNLEYGLVEVIDEDGTPIVGAVVAVETMGHETDVSGFAFADTEGSFPKRMVVSKAGYETERMELPASWPVKVTLKRQTK